MCLRAVISLLVSWRISLVPRGHEIKHRLRRVRGRVPVRNTQLKNGAGVKLKTRANDGVLLLGGGSTQGDFP